tara:strand:- start:767 stop:913 length:147 start_codon:yes stop_codon:yes gene_type:complete
MKSVNMLFLVSKQSYQYHQLAAPIQIMKAIIAKAIIAPFLFIPIDLNA